MVASAPILPTKLYIPPPTVVLRTRLIGQFNEGLAAGGTTGVTLISAPAGFGKTTLVSEWVAGCGRPAVWLFPSSSDSQTTRILTCLVAAILITTRKRSEQI